MNCRTLSNITQTTRTSEGRGNAPFERIDLDFLPIARDHIKRYAAKTYGSDKVCSVGLWQTYKPKLAIIDTCRALGIDPTDAQRMTKNLPDEFDEADYSDAYANYPEFKEYADKQQNVVRLAYRLIKLIKAQGRHAGGLIISSVPIKDHIPLTLSPPGPEGHWTSAWTEGKSTQLSKFGFVKFDILGLTNLLHIWNCKKLIKENKGVTFDFDDMDPEVDRAGWEIFPDGTKTIISFKDELAIQMANNRKVETIFQFETDLAKGIIAKGGVKSFNDLVVYTSLGRPGPMPLIDTYLQRRDSGNDNWKTEDDPRITKILEKTYNVITFQEQLCRFFVDICGFTVPEAEAARKAVAKKWTDQVAKLKDKIIAGATRTIGGEKAIEWWGKIETFAQYCFNMSHAVAYIVISYRSLYLKSHYPAEWWAAVMSNCKQQHKGQERLTRYMGIARAEGVKFGPIDFMNLRQSFHVSGDMVTPGLESIRGVGEKAASQIAITHDCHTLDELVNKVGKNKVVFERLIKLGAFDRVHHNRKALWYWYLYKYCSRSESIEAREEIEKKYKMSDENILKERQRKTDEYFKQYPNRKKIPNNITNWKPRISPTLEQFEETWDNYTYMERLRFEKEFLGYYWNSPVDAFKHEDHSIADAKSSGILEAVVEDITIRSSSNGSKFYQLKVTDGIEETKVMVWSNEIAINDEHVFQDGIGVRMHVIWNDNYSSFNVRSGSVIFPMEIQDAIS